MNREHIIMAWKDQDYREGLDAAAQALVPSHPSGAVELADADLTAAGAEGVTFLIFCESFDLDCDTTVFHGSCKLWTAGCCTALTDVV